MSSPKTRVSGRQIAAARELLRLSQGDLAAAVSMLPQALARIEADRVRPRANTLSRIINELERRGIEFINGRGVMLKKPAQDSPTEHESANE